MEAALRSFYEMERRPEKVDPHADRRVRLFLQLAVLVFWTPCLGVDALLLWRDRGGEGVNAFVFGLLFHQSLVFLALWFAVSLAHGLTTGRRTAAGPRPRRRRGRAAKDGSSLIAPVRYNRGQ